MTAVSKHVCNDKLDEKINKYNNKYHRIIKKEPVDVKVDTYIDYGFKYNKKDPEFKVGDQIEEDHYTKKYFCKGLHSKFVWGSLYNQESQKILYH